MKTWIVILAGSFALWSTEPRSQAADALSFGSASELTQWTVNFRDKPVMVYSFAPQKFKPYVKALYTLKGYNVLRDSPFDHLHHHALMYGIRVNGVNFWEETEGCGVEKVVSTSAPQTGTSSPGQPQATLTQVLHWVAPEDAFLPNMNAPTLLVERRTLALTLDEARQETALHWKSQFEVGTRTNVVVLSGANYHGLGMRFLQDLDPLAVHFYPEGKPDLSGNKQDVSAHKWEAVSFDAPGRPATIALFGDTGNARGDARFFSMRTPFAYLAATQHLDQEPLVFRKGDQFELNYLVVLYPEVKSPEAITARAQEWEKSKR